MLHACGLALLQRRLPFKPLLLLSRPLGLLFGAGEVIVFVLEVLILFLVGIAKNGQLLVYLDMVERVVTDLGSNPVELPPQEPKGEGEEDVVEGSDSMELWPPLRILDVRISQN